MLMKTFFSTRIQSKQVEENADALIFYTIFDFTA